MDAKEDLAKVQMKSQWAEGKEEDFHELHKAIKEGKAKEEYDAGEDEKDEVPGIPVSRRPMRGDWDSDYNADSDEEEEEEPPQEDKPKRILWLASRPEKMEEFASLLSSDPSALSRSADADGYTPLHRAAYSNHAEAVSALLDAGADLTALTADGWTPRDCWRCRPSSTPSR